MSRKTSDLPASVAVGLDLGGTNLKGAVVDHGGAVLLQQAVPTRSERGPQAVIETMAALVERLRRESGRAMEDVVGVGVGSPGPLSVREGVIIRCANLPGWDRVPLRAMLSDRLRCRVILENDANAAAFGEYWVRHLRRDDRGEPSPSTSSPFQGEGGGEGKVFVGRKEAKSAEAISSFGEDLVLLTLGTGVGGGVILEGKVLHGHFENAAELGHMIVAMDGLPCPCGQRGCLEQYASASAIARRVQHAMEGGEPSLLADRKATEAIDARAVAEAVRRGDPLCGRVWDEACRFLAVACVNIQHVYNPARIVLSGGLAEAGAILLERVRDEFRARRWTLAEDSPSIEPSQLGGDAGVVGAAGLTWSDAASA
jgi:glucokinase